MEDIRQRLQRLRKELGEVSPILVENRELREILPIICSDCGHSIVSDSSDGGCSLFHTIATNFSGAEEISKALR